MRKKSKNRLCAFLLGSMAGDLLITFPHEIGHGIGDYYFSGKFPSFGLDSDWNPVTKITSTVDSISQSGMAVIDAAGSAGNYVTGALLAAASEKFENPYKKYFLKGAALTNVLFPSFYSVLDLVDKDSLIGDFDYLNLHGVPYSISIPSTGMLSLGLSYLLVSGEKKRLESKLKQEDEGVKYNGNVFKEYGGRFYESLSSAYGKARSSFKNYL